MHAGKLPTLSDPSYAVSRGFWSLLVAAGMVTTTSSLGLASAPSEARMVSPRRTRI